MTRDDDEREREAIEAAKRYKAFCDAFLHETGNITPAIAAGEDRQVVLQAEQLLWEQRGLPPRSDLEWACVRAAQAIEMGLISPYAKARIQEALLLEALVEDGDITPEAYDYASLALARYGVASLDTRWGPREKGSGQDGR